MGHFEKGAWVKDPFDDFEESIQRFANDMSRSFQKLGDDLTSSFNSPTNQFRNGRALSLIELMQEITDSLPVSLPKSAAKQIEDRYHKRS